MARIVNKVLILSAHPAPRRSEVNRQMIRVAEWIPGVTLIDLYAEYPTFDIDVDAEQARLDDHDIVIFLHPMFWYSTPAILKEWQDLVLEYGYAYGEGGTKLHGKTFFSALSTGGAQEAYSPEGYNHFTVRQLLAPLEQTANLCGMRYLPPFVLHRARSAKELGTLRPHSHAWEDLLEALVHGRVDLDAATVGETLNPLVERLRAEV
ncbi:NAD(P)H-dependent oxidoreductase [Oceanibium sediminis]|uniref:NAD(P)H-dependent oxidoreductase n=1 Tax=Oceanibium sediminis TaxID=2026339 RepID=UPI000DD3C496|nr:NAD(P)H-dependent oxidoreductase [Oceanibium sediminis]